MADLRSINIRCPRCSKVTNESFEKMMDDMKTSLEEDHAFLTANPTKCVAGWLYMCDPCCAEVTPDELIAIRQKVIDKHNEIGKGKA